MTTTRKLRVAIGDEVSYEDLANPLKHGIVTNRRHPLVGGKVLAWEYEITWDDETVSWSDLKQAGWKRIPKPRGGRKAKEQAPAGAIIEGQKAAKDIVIGDYVVFGIVHAPVTAVKVCKRMTSITVDGVDEKKLEKWFYNDALVTTETVA
jgi:hypothetical protein